MWSGFYPVLRYLNFCLIFPPTMLTKILKLFIACLAILHFATANHLLKAPHLGLQERFDSPTVTGLPNEPLFIDV
jgi:hypothetical protein